MLNILQKSTKERETKSRTTNIEIVGRSINIHTKSNRGKKWKERDCRLKATKSKGKNNYWANFVHLFIYVGEGKMLIENNVG